MSQAKFETPQEFMDAWVDVFTTDYSYRNKLYGKGALHVILGRCLVNQRIKKRGSLTSPRISMFYLQGPSSGKSSGYAMIYEVLDALGITIKSPDETTDAALIGTVEKEVDEHGNETWEEQPGILSEAEVFHFDEASVIINPKKYQENMMTYLQKALNAVGSEQNKITKKLAHGEEITVQPNCSLLLTSYMPDGIEDTVLNTGFLQRMLTIPRNLSIEDRMEQTEQDIQALGEERQEADLEDLINELKSIRNFYNEPKEFNWEKAQPSLIKYSRQMYEEIQDTPIAVRRVLEGFVPRMTEQLYRLSFHYCCMRRSTTVTPRDVKNASPLILVSLRMIIHWLEENPELRGDDDRRADATQRFRAFREITKDEEPNDNGRYPVSRIMPGLKRAWGLSETSCYRWLSTFDDKGWIKLDSSGPVKYIEVEV